jgi:hypothetical protein
MAASFADWKSHLSRASYKVNCLQEMMDQQAAWARTQLAGVHQASHRPHLAISLAQELTAFCDASLVSIGWLNQVAGSRIQGIFYQHSTTSSQFSGIEVIEYPLMQHIDGTCSRENIKRNQDTWSNENRAVRIPEANQVMNHPAPAHHLEKKSIPSVTVYSPYMQVVSKHCRSLPGLALTQQVPSSENPYLEEVEKKSTVTIQEHPVLPANLVSNPKADVRSKEALPDNLYQEKATSLQKISCHILEMPKIDPVNTISKLKNKVFVNGICTNFSGSTHKQLAVDPDSQLRLEIDPGQDLQSLESLKVFNFIRYNSQANIYFLADASIVLSLDNLKGQFFKLTANWLPYSTMGSDKRKIFNYSRGSCLVEDSIYIINNKGNVESFNLKKLLDTPAERLPKIQPNQEFELCVVDLEYKHQEITYLTSEGTLYRALARQAGRKKKACISIDVTACSGYKFTSEACFRGLVSCKKLTIVTCFSQRCETIGLFALNEFLKPIEAFYFSNQHMPVQSLKLITKSKAAYFLALTVDSRLHILKSHQASIYPIVDNFTISDSEVRGMNIQNENIILVYGKSTAVVVDLTSIHSPVSVSANLNF